MTEREAVHPGDSFTGAEPGRVAAPRDLRYSVTLMKVILRNQGREVELVGRRRVKDLLTELGVLPETVLVIRGRDLLTVDEVVREDDVIELRPVISGGDA